jgi:hypothetical protein
LTNSYFSSWLKPPTRCYMTHKNSWDSTYQWAAPSIGSVLAEFSGKLLGSIGGLPHRSLVDTARFRFVSICYCRIKKNCMYQLRFSFSYILPLSILFDKLTLCYGNHNFESVYKSTISICAIFNSYVTNYQRVKSVEFQFLLLW